MHVVISTRSHLALALATLVFLVGGAAGTAVFKAPSPGAKLAPVDGAAELINLLQSNGALLWTSLAGPVSEIAVEGWPVVNGDNELGGALVIERPEDAMAGAINLGEPPMTAAFEVGG